MKTTTLAAAILAAGTLAAAPTGDRPDARHAWAVHDDHRPQPEKIEVPKSGIPSDATVLFDGTAESVARNWCDANGQPVKWIMKDGLFICTPGSGGAFTREHFGDCQLHVEFRIPDPPGAGRGNSGVILQSRYEVQVIDSHTEIPTPDPNARAWTRGDYADGQAGAIYGQHPPLVNPARAPGLWQTYDVIFHPPLEENGKTVDPGSMTVLMNGVLVQDAWPLEGSCAWRLRPNPKNKVAQGPLRLQDHGHPVAYRNVWIRRIPSRFADKTNGGPGVDEAAVAAKRAENAEKTFAWAQTLSDPEAKLMALAEAWAYRPSPEVRAQLDAAADAYVRHVESGAKPGPHVRLFAEMCERSGIFKASHPFMRIALKRPVKFE